MKRNTISIKFVPFCVILCITLVPAFLVSSCKPLPVNNIPASSEMPFSSTEVSDNTASTEVKETENDKVLIIESPAFESGENIPVKYTCDGENINPPLIFKDITSGTITLALIVDDPDAPGGTWTHWTLFNINPETTAIAENSVPEGSVEGTTDFGKPGYGGPCPPSGTHRYYFRLFALDTSLDPNAGAKISTLTDAIKTHIIQSAELFGLYSHN
jgi:Raf kinase inhibitor-like YbhB/YbcL family protein